MNIQGAVFDLDGTLTDSMYIWLKAPVDLVRRYGGDPPEDLARDLKEQYDAGKLSSVELIGVCTDICVISNALLIKAFMPELPVSVDPACCAGVTKEKHEAALETMRSCQILLP